MACSNNKGVNVFNSWFFLADRELFHMAVITKNILSEELSEKYGRVIEDYP